MRVGLLIYGSLDTLSGGYLYDRKLVDYLRAQGDTVEIVSVPWRNYARHLADNFSRDLICTLENLSIDVLIQDELNHPSLAWLNHQVKFPYPVLTLVHHLRSDELRPAWQNWFYRDVERRYLDSVNGFIFNSQTTRQAVDRVSEIEGRPWVVATPAGDRFESQISAAEIAARAFQPGPLRLIFIGNLISRKGLHTLIAALTQLPPGTCHLDIVGSPDTDPAYARKIRRQVESENLPNQIRFHGAHSDAALAELLRQSQALVVPASYEGFGIVYLEGLGFGLPAIGTTQGAAGEIIIPGKCGELIDPDDAAALARILNNWNQNREHLAVLGQNGRERYNQFPGWESSMAKIRTFLTAIR
jgi:glycosyltransferase involved in cell wall biosynthesis